MVTTILFMGLLSQTSSLAGTGSKQAVEFVSANLGKSVSIRHLQKIQTKKRPAPFIVHSSDDVIEIVLKQFNVIRSKLGNHL
jgi:hypothetical protein